MAMLERTLTGDFSAVVQRLHDGVLNGSASASYEGGTDFTMGTARCAVRMYERHTLLTSILTKLGVDPDTAVCDACKIEHDLSDESFEAIKRHVGKIDE